MNQTNNKSYFSTRAVAPVKAKEVALTVDKAVILIFKILNISEPSKAQLAFAKTEVISAKTSRTFKNMVLTFAGWCGSKEHYYDVRYKFVD